MLKVAMMMILSIAPSFSKPIVSPLFNCSKGVMIRPFSPQSFIAEDGVYSTKNFGASVYLDLKTGLKCLVYSSGGGKVYFQTKDRGDCFNTTWVMQGDGSYIKYDGAHIVAGFYIYAEDINNKNLFIKIKIVDDKNENVVIDKFTFRFKITPLHNV